MIFLKNKHEVNLTIFSTPLKILAIAAQVTTLSVAGLSSVCALGQVTHITTESVPATPSEYTAGGVDYYWGLGVDLKIISFDFNNTTYKYENLADKVAVIRVDNAISTGKRCAIFAQVTADESGYNYMASYPYDNTNTGNCDMAKVMGGRVINVGALDVFSNKRGPDTQKNIERIDFIFTKGIMSPKANSLSKTGHVVTEKGANNYVKIAAILSLDAQGNPASYGHLVLVHPRQGCDQDTQVCYGATNIRSKNGLLSNSFHPPQQHISIKQKILNERLGMAFVSLENLKISENTTYYGFSYFAKDTNTNDHTLTDPTTFPLDSPNRGVLSPGDADIYGGAAGYFIDTSCIIDCGTSNAPPALNFGSEGRFNIREVNTHKVKQHNDGGGVNTP